MIGERLDDRGDLLGKPGRFIVTGAVALPRPPGPLDLPNPVRALGANWQTPIVPAQFKTLDGFRPAVEVVKVRQLRLVLIAGTEY
jgi:hypothetical protein